MCACVWSVSCLSLDPDPICDLSLGLDLFFVFFLQLLSPSLLLVVFLSNVRDRSHQRKYCWLPGAFSAGEV